LDDLNEMNSEEPSAPPVSMDVPEAPEPSSLPAEKPMEESLPVMTTMVENTATSEAESSIAPASEVMEMKKEDDLVVEDVKSTDE
jgi:hypothetical protein